MENEKLLGCQKVFLIIGVIICFFIIGKKIADHQESNAIVKEMPSLVNKQDTVVNLPSKNETVLKTGYIVSCGGKAIDEHGKEISDKMTVSVSKLSDIKNKKTTAVIILQAVSATAKEEIEKPVVILPELVYKSVQSVAEKIIDLKKAKTKKAFNISMSKYLKTVKDSNEMVALHGFQIVEGAYTFEGMSEL